MKTMILLIAILFSTSAWACPDLTGTYVCNGEELTVGVIEHNGVTYYEFNSNAIPADNNWYSLEDTADEKNARVRMSCNVNNDYGDFALLDYESQLYDQGQYFADLDLEIFFHIIPEGLQQTMLGTVKSGGTEQPVNEITKCTRK